MKLDGKIIFTELEGYVEMYKCGRSELSLTLQIEDLIAHIIQMPSEKAKIDTEPLINFLHKILE